MIYLQDLLIEQEVLLEQEMLDRIKSLLKKGLTAAVLITTLTGLGLPDAKAQELVKKAETELVDKQEQIKVYKTVEEFQEDVSKDFDTFYNLRYPSKTLEVSIDGKSYTAHGAESKDMQTSFRKATPAGKRASIRAIIDLSKHNKSGYLGIVLIPN